MSDVWKLDGVLRKASELALRGVGARNITLELRHAFPKYHFSTNSVRGTLKRRWVHEALRAMRNADATPFFKEGQYEVFAKVYPLHAREVEDALERGEEIQQPEVHWSLRKREGPGAESGLELRENPRICGNCGVNRRTKGNYCDVCRGMLCEPIAKTAEHQRYATSVATRFK